MRIHALAVLLFFSIHAISQNCTNSISGKVIDRHDDTALTEASLLVMDSGAIVTADSEGNFTIPNLCDQTYTIQVSHPFCTPFEYRVKPGKNTLKNFRLEHHLEELNQITIAGHDIHPEITTLAENKLSREVLDRNSSGSLGDALNTIAGVSSLNTGNTIIKPMINGLHSSRVLVINNGVRLEDQDWGAEHAPNIDINSAETIKVIKGAAALQYGGSAIGGIVLTVPKKIPVKDTLYGKSLLSTASNGRGGSITATVTKSYESGWYAALQGTLKQFGDLETPDYALSNTGNTGRNASVRFGLNRFNYAFEGYYSIFKNEIGILRASHIGGASDQIRTITSNVPLVINDFTYSINNPRQSVTHQIARLKGFKEFSGFGKLSLQYDFQQNNRLEFDIRRGDNANRPSLDLELQTHSLQLGLDTDLSPAIELKSGIATNYQKNVADPSTGVRRLIPDYTKYTLGVYSTATFKINKNLQLESGARFDYTYMDVYKYYKASFWEEKQFNRDLSDIVIREISSNVLTNPTPTFKNTAATLGGHYVFAKDYALFLNVAMASRAPNPSELFSEGLHHSASRIELGDLRFKSEVSQKLSVTLKKEHGTFNFAINPYLNHIDNFIVIEPTKIQQTIRGNFQVWEYRQTKARLVGIDMDASYAFTKNLQFAHQFSIVKGLDISQQEALINMPAASTKNEIQYHNTAFHNLHLGLESVYTFRQNDFPDTNFEVYLPISETFETIDISTPPNAYHVLNFNASVDFTVTGKSKVSLGLSIKNIENTRYRNYLNRLRYYADELGRNFTFNIKYNF